MNGAARNSAFAALLLCASAGPAVADLKICNQTSYVLSVATAAVTTTEVATQGWSRITPGACRPVIPGALTASAYYVYARSSLAHEGPARAWGGDRPVCVKDVNFASRQPSTARDCSSDDFFPLSFAALDTHHAPSWTMTLSEGPNIASLDQARTAGLQRLLKDLGYRIAPIGARWDNASGAALADFRKRFHVSVRTSSADLFDALETGALKVTTSAGYSICNDTAKPLAAAIGEKRGADWVSHGWWKVEAGSCARAITTPLAADSIYLFAQRIGGTALVSGSAKFCTADIEFDIQGRARCKDRGLNEVGFGETRVKNLSGYAAHIGEAGLVASGYRTTSK